jgi:hypothetical protein
MQRQHWAHKTANIIQHWAHKTANIIQHWAHKTANIIQYVNIYDSIQISQEYVSQLIKNFACIFCFFEHVTIINSTLKINIDHHDMH